ncbi:MAG: NAD(P)-dependent glycerol-3-phosphate dehydrogenase [Chloroflexota bacterium]|nr:NAD(P)-dependent glycerol-3-phosphate dehydrogenase [Chloroflexota bacterium]MDE3194254.1 NAD(P)-dependent glycerol-3-phosphate dehydrogenase [Chloroflexota bacterium]
MNGAPEVGVLQAGSWGTTLATILARDGGRRVALWTRDPKQVEEMAARRENRRYLSGVRIPDAVELTADLARALEAPDLIVAVPAEGVRAFRERVAPLLRPGHRVLSATKGLAPDDGTRMSVLWSEAVGAERVAVLSGPNISREIAAGLPSPTVVASTSPETARHFQELIGTPMFRAYTNDDVVGVEVCGALKNIVALGAGAIDGMGYGDNAKAGFMTRGLAEIARFAFALGANPLTTAGLAGFGDLIATCMSKHSRNRLVGELLARGSSLEQVRERLGGQVAEGIGTTEATHAAAARMHVTMPIAEQTYLVLFSRKPIRSAMRDLMDRERGEEIAGPLADVARLVAQLAAARQGEERSTATARPRP